MSSSRKWTVPAFTLCGVIGLYGAFHFGMFYSGPVVRDTPFVREFNEVYRLTGKLVRCEVPLPKGSDSRRIEAFVTAGILSVQDEAYIRERGVEFHGFDAARTGADVMVFEAVCRNTKPARRIIGFADGHAEYRKLPREP
ncbi:MAG: hypothetical protein ACREIC_16805 [Limisphaerales bacterium]